MTPNQDFSVFRQGIESSVVLGLPLLVAKMQTIPTGFHRTMIAYAAFTLKVVSIVIDEIGTVLNMKLKGTSKF